MHEFALAESVIRSAVKIAGEERLERISEINVRVGELQQMSMEAFDFGLKAAMEAHGSMAGSAKVNIETEKASFACRVCRRAWDFDETRKGLSEEEAEYVHFVPEVAHAYLRCPECGSPDFEVVKGRGIWLDSVKGRGA
ncbi:MAG: hydrogenase nickel incorporation protein HypA [Elusimicrobiota bacterium]